MKKIIALLCVVSLLSLSGCANLKKAHTEFKKHCSVDLVTKKVTCAGKW